MTKYFLTTKQDPQLPISAKQVDPIKDYLDAGLDLFFHRSLYDEGWTISEVETGAKLIGIFPTKEEAINELHGVINQVGIKQALVIKDQLKKQVEQMRKNAKSAKHGLEAQA